MSILSVGGNDIDFPRIIFNCILEISLPLGYSPKKRTRDEQKQITWDLLISPDLANKIADTIDKAVKKTHDTRKDHEYKLYVTGFPQFFIEETRECDDDICQGRQSWAGREGAHQDDQGAPPGVQLDERAAQ